jgi:predicted CXXCH cytochrome family protein
MKSFSPHTAADRHDPSAAPHRKGVRITMEKCVRIKAPRLRLLLAFPTLLPLIASVVMVAAITDARAEIGPENERCLICHTDKRIIKMGGKHLYIDSSVYAATTHSYIGCRSCHTAISEVHPNDDIKPPRPTRATCRECHLPIHAEYAKSLHSSKASCTDCHNPHAVKTPLSISGKDINDMCAKCHNLKKVVATHITWLPQADLHIDALPCITCHTSSQNYVITMAIQTRKPGEPTGSFRIATHDELSRLLPEGSDLSSLIDRNMDRLISLEDLRAFNSKVRRKEMRLWGMMTPEMVSHSYDILDNRRQCSFCHASGTEAMQKSYVAFPDKSRGYTRVAVERGATLDILNATPDFYMLGATRSTPLTIIGGLIMAAGLVMPLGHGTVRLLTRARRRKPLP